jgi:hypothetical protein
MAGFVRGVKRVANLPKLKNVKKKKKFELQTIACHFNLPTTYHNRTRQEKSEKFPDFPQFCYKKNDH